MNPIRKVVREIVNNVLNESSVVFNKATGFYSINGNVVERLEVLGENLNKENFLDNNKDNKAFSWLFNASFYAQEIVIDARGMSVSKFVGEWYDGIFKGEYFTNHLSGGQIDSNRLGFNGGTFNGQVFDLNYTYWRVAPTNFIGGTVENSGDGLLGLPDLESGIIKGKNHIMQAPVGKYILFKIQGDDEVYPIKVIKRLDDRNSDFKYLDVITNKSVVIPWEIMRSSFNSLFIGRSKNGFIMPGLINLSGVIERVEISDDIKGVAKKRKNDAVNITSYKIPLSKLSQVFNADIDIPVEDIKQDMNGNDKLKFMLQRVYNDFNKNDGKEFLRSIKKVMNHTILTWDKIDKKELSGL
jgi:hypothetical protein